MVQPFILANLTQVFRKHYKLPPDKAAEEAARFIEILELYELRIIKGEWIVPETIIVRPTAFDILMETERDTMERKPWLAEEIQ